MMNKIALKIDFSRTATLAAATDRSFDLSNGALAGILDKSKGKSRGVILGNITLLLDLLHALPCRSKLLFGVIRLKKQQVTALVIVQTHLPKSAALRMMDLVVINIQRVILEIIPGQCDRRAVRYVGMICG